MAIGPFSSVLLFSLTAISAANKKPGAETGLSIHQ